MSINLNQLNTQYKKFKIKVQKIVQSLLFLPIIFVLLSIDFRKITHRKCATWDIRSCAIINHRAHKTNIYYRDGRAFMMMRVREYGATISASFNHK